MSLFWKTFFETVRGFCYFGIFFAVIAIVGMIAILIESLYGMAFSVLFLAATAFFISWALNYMMTKSIEKEYGEG